MDANVVITWLHLVKTPVTTSSGISILFPENVRVQLPSDPYFIDCTMEDQGAGGIK